MAYRLENSTQARPFIDITSFKYQPYLDIKKKKKKKKKKKIKQAYNV